MNQIIISYIFQLLI